MIDKKIRQSRLLRAMPVFAIVVIALLVVSVPPVVVSALTESPYPAKTSTDTEGRHIDGVVFTGQPLEVKAAVVSVPEPNLAMGINVLTDVPAFNWSYGCSPTAAAMLFGYYDRTAYPDMYTGPANGGVCPMDNTIWGSGDCPLSATHQGIDGLGTPGHVDDYWLSYGSTANDPWLAGGVEHTHADCTGDFMGSNQSSFGNIDGGTTFYFEPNGSLTYDHPDQPGERDGCHGMRLFAESRGYTVVTNYSQYIEGRPGNDPGLGFTFDDFQAEIDAGRPVLIHATNDTTDHTMLGYGYDTTGSIVYIHDTYDHDDHEMTWGGSYSGAQHIGVTVIVLEDTLLPTVSITASDVDINDGDTGPSAFTITAIFSETMDPSYTPTVVFNPQLNSTLINTDGVWSAGDTVYTWTFDIADAGVKVDDVDVTVDGGRDLSGDAQVPGTNTDYIDVDTQNPTASIVASDVAINDSDVGVDALTITATFSEVMDEGYIPTLVFDPLLTSTLTNPSGIWSAGNTVYTWTFDIEDAGEKVDDVDVSVDKGRDLAGNVQVPGTITDYIDVDNQNPTVSIIASDLSINDGDVGIDAFTITATFSEAMDNSYVPKVVFTPTLNTTLTNPSGVWSAGDTVYIWTFDIEDAGVKVDDADVTVEGAIDMAGNTQVPGTNTDYIDIDTQNPTVTITDVLDYVNALNSITGTAFDPVQGDIQKVEVVIGNTTDNEYWDGNSWISNETWIDAIGTTSWSYDTRYITFNEGDSYSVIVKATDKAGNTSAPNSDSFTFCESPVAAFEATPTNGNARLTVQFKDESTGIINTYTWDFGDGQTNDDQNPSHIYDSQGIYTVTLTVAGPGGTDIETKSDLISVEKRSDPGGCTCFLTDEKTSTGELLLGWGAIFLCLGIGYYLGRRARKARK